MKIAIVKNVTKQQESEIFFELRKVGFSVYKYTVTLLDGDTLYVNSTFDDRPVKIKDIIEKFIVDANIEYISVIQNSLSQYIQEKNIKEEKLRIKKEKSKTALPINFLTRPSSSIFLKLEAEIIASNIMKILNKTQGVFRELSFEEYKSDRLKQNNFSEQEEFYFNKVVQYTTSGEKAIEFCENWYEDISYYEKRLEEEEKELRRLEKAINQSNLNMDNLNRIINLFNQKK